MRRLIITCIIIAAALAAIVICSKSVDKSHIPGERRGRPPYERVVSLSPALTDNIYALGAESKLYGVTTFRPEQAADKQVVGTLIQPNIEKVVSLQPDVVLATKEGNRRKPIERLMHLGLNVEVFEPCTCFADICFNFICLGELLGEKDRALQIVQQARTRVTEVINKLEDAQPRRVFWQVGARPLFTVAQGTFVNDFIEFSRGRNIFADLPNRFARISREEVIRRNPEVIILPAMGEVGEEERKEWARFPKLDAVKNQKIFVVNPDNVCRPVPLRFAAGLEEVARCIHPEAFKQEK